MKNSKKLSLISAVMAIIVTSSMFVGLNASAVDIISTDSVQMSNLYSEQEQIIYNYFESINTGNWDTWASNYAPSVRDDYITFVNNPNNIANNVGILTVNNVQVTSVQKVSNLYAPKMYPELQNFYYNENNYECYAVEIDTKVNEDNGYFGNGISKHLVVLVKDGDEWGVGTICGYSDNSTVSRAANGTGYGLIEFISEPSTIDVMDEKGVIHYDEDFTDFIVNVTCNEVGTQGYSTAALKANVMAVKMCGWWAKAGTYRETYGCDIKYGDVAYKSSLATTPEQTEVVQTAVDNLDGYYMVSSSGELFYSAYFAGTSSTTGKGTGQLRQNGSEYLATQYNYTWKNILHYYYDNSSYNNPDVGTVKIKST